MKKNKKKKKEKNIEPIVTPVIQRDVKKSIYAILLLIFALIFILSLIGQAGLIGKYVDHFLALGFGWGRYVLPLIMVIVGIIYFKKMDSLRYLLTTIGALITFVFILIILHSFFDLSEMAVKAKQGLGGGYLGMTASYFLVKYLGIVAALILSFGCLVIGMILTFNFPLHKPFYWFKDLSYKWKDQGFFSMKVSRDKSKLETDKTKDEIENESDITEDNIKVDTIQYVEDPNVNTENKNLESENEEKISIKSKIKNSLFSKRLSTGNREKRENKKMDEVKVNKEVVDDDWNPPTAILSKSQTKAQPKNLQRQAETIKKTLGDYGIQVDVSGFNVGPSVIQYTFKPAVGIKLNRIVALQNELTLALAASSVRIEAPIPGKSLVGIEVPLYQSDRSIVGMKSVIESEAFKKRDSNLTIVLGEDVHGDLILGGIEKMPHLMIAGATGTGKSVSINSVLISLLYQNSPDKLKLILIDPKRVELSAYNGIPHLLTPVITDTGKVVNALKWAVSEMEDRYKTLQSVGSRDIHSFNKKVKKGKKRQVLDKESGKYRYEELRELPFIVIILDELADIMASHGREVEGAIVRLTQMARAVGIHVIVSTQRPSVNVITGIIKANINTRIAFQVATQVDSRTILDIAGAEKLLGNGDMLYKSVESQKPRRIQGVFVSEREVRSLVKWIRDQDLDTKTKENEKLSDSLKESLEKEDGSMMGLIGNGGGGADKDDALFKQAREIVIQTQKASTTFIQRKLGIGYPKAANIMDMLESEGVVGEQEGSKPRKVLISIEDMEKNE